MNEPTTLESLWSAVTTVTSNLMTIVGSVGNAIISNTLFQIIFGVSIAYTGVRLFKRLVHVR